MSGEPMTLEELELRYDGPIPPEELAAARYGIGVAVNRWQALAYYWRREAIHQLTRVIWPRRRAGTYLPDMADTCRDYCRYARAAEAHAARLRAAAFPDTFGVET